VGGPTWGRGPPPYLEAVLVDRDGRRIGGRGRGAEGIEEGDDLHLLRMVQRLEFVGDARRLAPWARIASSRVVARPSWRYGAESATPQSGGVFHSGAIGTVVEFGGVVASPYEPMPAASTPPRSWSRRFE